MMCAVLLEGDGGRESYVFLSHTKGQGGSQLCHHQSTNSQERKIAAYYSYETKGNYTRGVYLNIYSNKAPPCMG